MKRLITAIVILISADLKAEDSIGNYKTITATNWIAPGPYLRVVNGQTYNIAYSDLWGQPAGGPTSDDDSGHFIRYEVTPEKIKGNKTFCEMEAVQWWYDYYGHPKDEGRWPVKNIVIYNAPTNIILGLPYKFKCMKVGDLIDGNRFICEAYDCGIQDTNLIPVVKTMRVRNN
jgi:hypothetical protein